MKRNGKSPQTILVVEDIAWIRAAMKSAVEKHGYGVMVAADAEEALSVAKITRPALILTEEELPTIKALKERVCHHPALRGVPIVIVKPDEEENLYEGEVIVLTGHDQIKPLLASLPASLPETIDSNVSK